jgi:RimJ/RimL family protein N-acetyltransferase
MATTTALRSLDTHNCDAVFEMMGDPAAVRMAAFTAPDPTDRAAFDSHMAKLFGNPGIQLFAIVDESSQLVGTISTFPSDGGLTEVTYWVDREHWGRGHASHALSLVTGQVGRPLVARVVADNDASRRVLDKAGFRAVGTDRDFAAGRQAEVEEVILRLE